MIITGDDLTGISDLKQFLSQHFEIQDLGSLSYFLSIEVSSASDGYSLSQAKYASDLLSRAGLTDSKTTSTPLDILRYIKGTLFHGLHFSAHSSLELRAYSDADWAGDPTDRRSTTGYCFFLGFSNPGVARSKLSLPGLVLRLSTKLLQTPFLSFFGYVGC